MKLAMANICTPPPPKHSMARHIGAIIVFVAPPNNATIASAAPKDDGIPSSGAKTAPKLLPMKNSGRISPPLNPAPSVIAVNRILSMNAK